ncbi:MAG: tetratricopeptide repeat protein [Bdellovibrionota bacterium]
MVNSSKYPPLLLKYLKMFQENPRSKIFAPLAESYRKIGLVDEAIEICREGLAVHPDFIGGKVALARAYADKQSYAQVRALLAPIIEHVPDNLVAQRLLADACLSLGHVKEALESYKMLLYFNPNDHEVVGVVHELETQAYQTGGLLRFEQKPEKLRRLMRLQKMLNRVQQVRTSLRGP